MQAGWAPSRGGRRRPGWAEAFPEGRAPAAGLHLLDLRVGQAVTAADDEEALGDGVVARVKDAAVERRVFLKDLLLGAACAVRCAFAAAVIRPQGNEHRARCEHSGGVAVNEC